MSTWHQRMLRVTGLLWLTFFAGLAAWVFGPGCSLSNIEGPDVTCQDLQCGKINACKEGIIASCADGQNVKFHVCTDDGDDICDEDWQVIGQYKCDEFITECEGCRPERTGCVADAGTD